MVDADGHVFETFPLWEQLRDEYMPAAYAEAFGALLKHAQERFGRDQVPTIHIWGAEGREPHLSRGRPLGLQASDIPVSFDVEGRLRDMDLEGIDVAVVYPTTIASFCALESPRLERAIYAAYNRWISSYCDHQPDRLKYVAVVPLRDLEGGALDVRQAAADPNLVGLYCQTHIGTTQLDQPHFAPLWETAQDLGLPVAIHHAGAAMPPWGLGLFEMGDNWFLQHAAANPLEQMRAIATVVGGGVMERYPQLQVAFLEAGCGWLPYWLDRLDEHRELMPHCVPVMERDATEVFAGGRCFISFEPDEGMLPNVIAHLGDDAIVFASDYPHFDCEYPDSAKTVAERTDLSDASKGKLLSGNAKRLYPRLA